MKTPIQLQSATPPRSAVFADGQKVGDNLPIIQHWRIAMSGDYRQLACDERYQIEALFSKDFPCTRLSETWAAVRQRESMTTIGSGRSASESINSSPPLIRI